MTTVQMQTLDSENHKTEHSRKMLFLQLACALIAGIPTVFHESMPLFGTICTESTACIAWLHVFAPAALTSFAGKITFVVVTAALGVLSLLLPNHKMKVVGNMLLAAALGTYYVPQLLQLFILYSTSITHTLVAAGVTACVLGIASKALQHNAHNLTLYRVVNITLKEHPEISRFCKIVTWLSLVVIAYVITTSGYSYISWETLPCMYLFGVVAYQLVSQQDTRELNTLPYWTAHIWTVAMLYTLLLAALPLVVHVENETVTSQPSSNITSAFTQNNSDTPMQEVTPVQTEDTFSAGTSTNLP